MALICKSILTKIFKIIFNNVDNYLNFTLFFENTVTITPIIEQASYYKIYLSLKKQKQKQALFKKF